MAGKTVSATEKKVADAQLIKNQSPHVSKKPLTQSADNTNDINPIRSGLNGKSNDFKQQSAKDTKLTESLPSEAFLLFLADAIDVNGEVTDVLDMEEVEEVGVSESSDATSNNQSKSDELKQKDVKTKPEKKNTTSSQNRINPKLSEEK